MILPWVYATILRVFQVGTQSLGVVGSEVQVIGVQVIGVQIQYCVQDAVSEQGVSLFTLLGSCVTLLQP